MVTLRRRSILSVAVIIALVIATLLLWRPEIGDVGRDSRNRRQPDSGAPRTTQHDGPDSLTPSESRVPASGIAPLPISRRVRLMNLATRGPASGVAVSHSCQEAQNGRLVLTSDGSGALALPDPAPLTLTMESSDWEFLTGRRLDIDQSHATESSLLETTMDTIWVCPLVTIVGHVRFESPTLVTAGTPGRVTIGPVETAPGEWIADATRFGSPGWLRAHAKHIAERTIPLATDTFTAVGPALGTVSVSVWAPGHRVQSQSVGTDSPTVHLRFDLARGERAKLRLVDPDGRPIKKACVQYIADRSIPIADLNAHIEMLSHRSNTGALTVTTSAKTGNARIAHTAQAFSDDSGNAVLDQLTEADSLYLVIWAEGREPVIRKQSASGEFADSTVPMKAVQPLREFYRFVENGEPLGRGTLMLAENLDGLTPAMPTIESLEDGRFPSSMIVPGRTYHCVFSCAAKPAPISGWCEFGRESDIDISTFRGRP
jgi:hypothetical protein